MEKPKISIRLASNRVNPSVASHMNVPRLYSPGENIIKEEGFMRLVWGVNTLVVQIHVEF